MKEIRCRKEKQHDQLTNMIKTYLSNATACS